MGWLVCDLMCGWVLVFVWVFICDVWCWALGCCSMFGLRYCGYMVIWLLHVLIVLVYAVIWREMFGSFMLLVWIWFVVAVFDCGLY